MKRTKLVLCIALLALAVLLLSSCSRKSGTEELTSNLIGETLVERLSMSGMVKVQQENITARFDIATEVLKSDCVYVSADVNNADEIVVFEVKDKKDMDLVYAALGIHNNQKAQTFKELDKTEYQKVEGTILTRKEPYVIMVTAEQSNKANAIISHFFPDELSKRKN